MEMKLCSTCGTKPRVNQADDATNLQCRECKYESQKRWTVSKENQKRAEAFVEGVNAMREYLAVNFEPYPPLQKFSGKEIAAIVRRVDGPRPVFADVAAVSGVAS